MPRWALASAGAAPLVLVGGWTIAASRQPSGYDPIRDTISALAALGATDRWVMTGALYALGACDAVTGAGLRLAHPAGRILLVGGGLATMMVATFPQPVQGNAIAHTIAATIAFVLLAAWPLGTVRDTPGLPLSSRGATLSAVAVMFALLAWFTIELHGAQRGLAERAAALTEALWPLAVVVGARSTRWRRRRDEAATCSAGAA